MLDLATKTYHAKGVPLRRRDHSTKAGEREAEEKRASKVAVYFHGNAEDVGMSYSLLVKLSVTLECSVLAVEYPGYGVYKSEQAEAETLLANAHLVV